ncbi:MAG: hypothetical protein ACR2QC_08585 [Gammaproteobacteria bacterium]
MGHELRYEMGNAGDIIKHGLLAEFVRWYKSAVGECLRFADPFGGCPWGDLNHVVGGRLAKLKNSALSDAYPRDENKYFGSSHLVRQAAGEFPVNIYVSDKDEDARCKLDNSFSEYRNCMELIKDLPPGNDGYAILDGGRPENYDLILIDPYSEFLLEECNRGNKRFNAILSLTEACDSFFAVFILDKKENHVHRNLRKVREQMLEREVLLSLRCPKMVGERHAYEMWLISSCLKNQQATADLRTRLRAFSSAAEKALDLENMVSSGGGEEFSRPKIMHWGLGDE